MSDVLPCYIVTKKTITKKKELPPQCSEIQWGKKKGEKQYSNELAAHQLKKKKTNQR